MRLMKLAVCAVTIALAACASGGGGGSTGGGGDRNLISGEELTGVSASNVYEAVNSLRPSWLRNRGVGLPAAFLDGTHRGDIVQLRNIPLTSVTEIRFLEARDATTMFGTGYPAGIINVITH